MRGFGLAPDDISPRGEDGTNGMEGTPVFFFGEGSPPGENKKFNAYQMNDGTEPSMEWEAQGQAETDDGYISGDEQLGPDDIDFISMVRDAEALSLFYAQGTTRKAWTRSYRAFHQEHDLGSRYTQNDWRGRSRLFIPKTRAAVRKDNAAVAASLFNSISAIDCDPGNEADPQQRAAAALMKEIVNFRVGGRPTAKTSVPWFLTAMGARQDAVLTGVCCSKQFWLQKFRKKGEEDVLVQNPETGVHEVRRRDVYTIDVDRPEILNIPPENYSIDATADWRNPAQSSSYFIIHWPMQMDEIREKQEAPRNPWNDISEAELRSAAKQGKYDTEAVRKAREAGHDRMDESKSSSDFSVIWVSEVYIRTAGEDWTFYCCGDHYLTNPRPVREVYPEQQGERPITLGYGALEAHRIYPMSPAESWQPLQSEANDLRNLMLDAIKQNVMPVSKVRRGRQIDLDQVRRRSSGSSIIVQEPDDVTWDKPPEIPQGAIMAQRELALEFDDLAGQQNYGSVETNNALGKTLGGLKLAAGAANAVQEFDVRVWIETWTAPTLQQVVRLEQYFESDEIVLGLCGAKAKLMIKHGVNEINDQLLEQDITIRVSVGLGAGDPQQRLQKFATAAQIVTPILASSPDFQSGKRRINEEAVIDEVFGACGYKDGGQRFFIDEENPPPNPMGDLKAKEIEANIENKKLTGKAAFFTGLSSLAKVALGKKELEAEVVDNMLGRQIEARELAYEHAHRRGEQHLAAMDHGHRHGMEVTGHKQGVADGKRKADFEEKQAGRAGDREDRKQGHAEGMANRSADLADRQQSHTESQAAAEAERLAAESMGDTADQGDSAGGAGATPQTPRAAAPAQAPEQGGGMNAVISLLQKGEIEFVRGPNGRIAGFRLKQGNQPNYQLAAA